MTQRTEPAEPRRSVRTLRYLTLALTALLLLGVGWTAATLTTGRTPGEESAEAGFARDMSRHHAQAVEMAMIAYDKGQDPAIRQMGYDMALTQQAQIGHMQRWLQEWELLPTGSRPAMEWMPDGVRVGQDGLMPGMATRDEITQLHEAPDAEVDRLFIRLMINHHLGGVHMADGLLKVSDRPEVVRMAQAMKQTQQKEINELRKLELAAGG
ncbi:Uncharacterized conserved protein, DUF305 family [Micromonospora phaseoli]|uniref:Uncharacterized conserved protein, DUF305 family n=1 Tax=Micromonospora phaseoli TaxID=1144548 RepID=A0A1H6WTS0_9ACTN|nr:DUF305 domain-containing protein [Micromonospora phaseoli]PZW01791.1 uncharacterized protein (DUF305 family) [Micromonospora phaseoli]GIJ78175.1 DUF305 domain-containing protein [Micromonospora phaseoli]SEJ15735.1 Uncharacterized conserved protein, DUF305 family [Micromonospora phaseoli]